MFAGLSQVMEKRLEVPRGACDEYVLPSDIARGRWADGLPMQDLGDASLLVEKYIVLMNSECADQELDGLDDVAQVLV